MTRVYSLCLFVLNLLRSIVQLLILITFISPVFFNTLHIPTFSPQITKLSASCMDGWFKFTPVSAVQKGVIGRKRKLVSRLSRRLDHNAERHLSTKLTIAANMNVSKRNTTYCNYSTYAINGSKICFLLVSTTTLIRTTSNSQL